MRRNIDLTENMMFSRNGLSIRSSILRHKGKNLWRKFYNWNFDLINDGSQKDSIIDRERQIIHLGDYTERHFIKECIEMDSGNFCDCCGASLLKHPWSRQFGLCKRCASEINGKYTEKKLWPNSKMKGDRRKII